MASMNEACSICAKAFEVQFRYQMEERGGEYLFFCSQTCQQRSLDSAASGAVCSVCSKRFQVELVAQTVMKAGKREYACSEECRVSLLDEAPPFAAQPKARSAAPQGEQAVRAGHKVALFNHKGGTGKTTTSVSLAAGLAKLGRKVLLVDTDSQGNVGVSLGIEPTRTLYHVLVMGMAPREAVQTVGAGFDVLASNETLAAAELYLAGRQNRDRVLREKLASIASEYDHVLVDCSPSLSLLNQNALVFADEVIIPVACDFLSFVGVRQVIKTVKNVNALLHHPLQIRGVLPTLYDARARICKEAHEAMKSHFGEKCFAPIRANIKVKEAPSQGQTIFEYAPDSQAAEDYMRIARILTANISEENSSSRYDAALQGSAVA